MNNFEEKEMRVYDPDQSKMAFEETLSNLPENFDGYVFHAMYRDPVGNSGGNPTWGRAYRYCNGEISYVGDCLYKCMDYDEMDGPYAEKLWSMFGKKVLDGGTRVPEITLIKDSRDKETGILSHIILDNAKEDLILMRSVLFHKYDRQTMVKLRSIFPIQDLLESVKLQIIDSNRLEESTANYKEVESQIIQTLLLDAVTNNADRHAKNWGLIRDKKTNKYVLGVFDHSSSFLDMISERPRATGNSYWTTCYLKTDPNAQSYGLGISGDKMIKYLIANYPDEVKKFNEKFVKALPEFLEELSNAPSSKIHVRRMKFALEAKKKILDKLIREREVGGEERD